MNFARMLWVLQAGRGEQAVGALPDAFRGVRVEQIGDVEVARELQVRPVIERVAQGVGDDARPRPGISRAEWHRRCRSARGTPSVRMARHL